MAIVRMANKREEVPAGAVKDNGDGTLTVEEIYHIGD